MLRKRYDDPQRWLKVVNIDIERCVLFIPKSVISLRKSEFEHGTILLCENQVLFPRTLFGGVAICQIHLSWHRAGDGEVHIHIWLGGNILEVDCGVVLVLWLAEVEGELVVDGKIVEAALFDGVTKIVVLGVTLLAVVSSYSFSSAEAVATPVITQRALPIALTLAALPTIDRVPKEPLTAPLAVLTLGVVLTGLLAHPGGRAGGMAVALAQGARREVPLLLNSRAHGAV